MLLEDVQEYALYVASPWAREQGDSEDLAATGVAHCQRFALLAVPCPPPPLDIDGP
jgi:hypothetical protein